MKMAVNRINLLPGAQRSSQLRRRRLAKAMAQGIAAAVTLSGLSWAALLGAQHLALAQGTSAQEQLSAWRDRYEEAVSLQNQLKQAQQWRQRLAVWRSSSPAPHQWLTALEASWMPSVQLHALRLSPQHLHIDGTVVNSSPQPALGEWVLSAHAQSVAAEVLEMQMAPQASAAVDGTQGLRQFRVRWTWPAAATATVTGRPVAAAPKRPEPSQ